MEPKDEMELHALMRVHEDAEKNEHAARDALYAFVRGKLLAAKRGEVESLVQELMVKMKKSRGRIYDIRAGKWSRIPERNPPEKP